MIVISHKPKITINENKISAMQYSEEIENLAQKMYMQLYNCKNESPFEKSYKIRSIKDLEFIICDSDTFYNCYGPTNKKTFIGFYRDNKGDENETNKIYINGNKFNNSGKLFRTLIHELEHYIDYKRKENRDKDKKVYNNYLERFYIDSNEFTGEFADAIREIQYYLWDDTEFNAYANLTLFKNFDEIYILYNKLAYLLSYIKKQPLEEHMDVWEELEYYVENSTNNVYKTYDENYGRQILHFRGDNLDYLNKRINKNPEKWDNSSEEYKSSVMDRAHRYEIAYARRHFIAQSYKRLKRWFQVMKRKYMYYQMNYDKKQFKN